VMTAMSVRLMSLTVVSLMASSPNQTTPVQTPNDANHQKFSHISRLVT
jgi:hypothetical protein